jgi:hypothetical protein
MGRKASKVEEGDRDADPEEHREQWRAGPDDEKVVV